MLFSSWIFVGAFLPVVWGVYRLLQSYTPVREVPLAWLVVASLFFYGWFEPVYVLVILASIVFNFSFGLMLGRVGLAQSKRRLLAGAGIAANLLSLGYYKYTGLFFTTVNNFGADLTVPEIVLPIGISFFTFQQIAWLVDAYRHQMRESNFLHYALFISFFPQLVAGPIVHHNEMMPQFARRLSAPRARRLLAMGVTLFIIGLFKKVGFADHLAEIADPVFDSAARGTALTLFESWVGVLAYTLQIYFDFSGYSDMALGLAAMFGIRLPLNFLSPYKSASITDFWRRWHITLSRFLRDYLYIPLGGNRKGLLRRLVNLFVTMMLGGLWHGANWTFLVWGALHGVYLALHQLWQKISAWRMPRPLGVGLTFGAVMVAWVFFRAENFPAAMRVLEGMTGKHGIALQNPDGWLADMLRACGIDIQSVGNSRNLRLNEKWYILWLALGVALFAPSAHYILRGKVGIDVTHVAEASGRRASKRKKFLPPIIWVPSWRWGLFIGFLFAVSLLLLTRVNAFIYFQF